MLYFLIVFSVLGMEQKYKKVKIVEKDIYFPYSISEKIEKNLEDNSLESYVNLAEIYIELEKKEAAKYYYEDYKKSSKNYLKLSELAHRLDLYEEEIEFIDKYILRKGFEEKKTYYEYIKKMIKEKNLEIDLEKYEIKKIEELFYYINEKENFLKIYSETNWNDMELNWISEKLKENLFNLEYVEIYLELISDDEKLDYYLKNINGLEDRDGYFIYFTKMEEFEKDIDLKTDFEKLYYYEYKEDYKAYDEYFKKVKKRYIKFKNIDALGVLYKLRKDFDIIYNLAIIKDLYMYELIVNFSSFSNYLLSKEELIEEFYRKYPDSSFKGAIELIAIQNKSEQSKLEFYNSRLKEKYSESIFKKKIELLFEIENFEELQYELENYIFKIYQNDDYITKYIYLMEKMEKEEELLRNLEKISDKKYYINEMYKKNRLVAEEYSREIIKLYMEKMDFEKLYVYKDKLLKTEIYEIIERTNDQRFLKFAMKKFNFEKKWIDYSKYENLYFNYDFSGFNLENIENLILKEDKNDYEIYYLSRYYFSISDYEKSKEVLNEIYEKYRIEEGFIVFKDMIDENIRLRNEKLFYENFRI